MTPFLGSEGAAAIASMRLCFVGLLINVNHVKPWGFKFIIHIWYISTFNLYFFVCGSKVVWWYGCIAFPSDFIVACFVGLCFWAATSCACGVLQIWAYPSNHACCLQCVCRKNCTWVWRRWVACSHVGGPRGTGRLTRPCISSIPPVPRRADVALCMRFIGYEVGEHARKWWYALHRLRGQRTHTQTTSGRHGGKWLGGVHCLSLQCFLFIIDT